MAKSAAAILIEDIHRFFKNVSVISSRLPRLARLFGFRDLDMVVSFVLHYTR